MHERDILLAALEKTRPEERAAYLTQVCGSDAELRGRLESLLQAAEVQDSFLEHPAAETELFSRETDGIRRQIAEQEEVSLSFLQPVDEPGALGRLGPYTITEVIGRGGMGVVLKARDTKLNRIVAIKVLAPELASNPTARKRFQREAHAAAAVVHQHIVTIHAVDEDILPSPLGGEGPGVRSLPYLVMECIVGQSLKDKIDREGHLKLVEILRIGQQVASGLAAAHAHGLIHRDVKPANILLENGVERVRITDFGLARAVDDVGMTRTGEVAGTPQYMSPEQAQGLPMDGRGDLFSFGCVLYAMCTGRPPFRAESSPAVLHRICHDTPRPIQEINPEIPDWLLAIIDRLLQKNPAERFQSAKEVADLLGQYLAHAQQPAIVPFPGSAPVAKDRQPRRRAQSWSWAVVAVIAAVAMGIGLTEASGVTNFGPTVIRIVRGEGTLAIEVHDPTVQVSLDGEEIAIRGAGLQELKLTAGKYRVQASKNGQPFKDEVVTITRDGKKVVTVTLESSGGTDSPSIAPAIEASVGELRLLAKLDGHTDLVRDVALLPDGRRIVSIGRDKQVRIWDLQTRSAISSFAVEGYLRDADVSADGRFVAVVFTNGRKKAGAAHVWDLERGQRVCELAQDFDWTNCVRFSADGKHLVTGGVPGYGVLWEASTGTELRRLSFGETAHTDTAAFSLDGRLLALGAVGGVRLFDAESGDVVEDVRLPNHRHVCDLVFSSNGKTLASGQLGGHVSLIDVDSRRVTKVLQSSDSHVYKVRFVNDDRFLLCSSETTLQIWDVQQEKVVATAITAKGTNGQMTVSPDGRYAITGSGEQWDSGTNKWVQNGDYALRLWQLPESVWANKATDATPTKELPSVSNEPGAFVLLAAGKQRKFDTLTEAVQSASDGDTIEIRGNGPFVSDGVAVANPLVIRAGEGYSPSITLSQTSADQNIPLLSASASLVLEGLELRRVGGAAGRVEDRFPALLKAWPGETLRVTNCRLVIERYEATLIGANVVALTLRNCELSGSVAWFSALGGRCDIENCVYASGGFGFSPSDPDFRDVSIRVRDNTFVGDCINLTLWSKLNLPDKSGAIPPFRLDVSRNVMHPWVSPRNRGVLYFHQYQFEEPFSAAEAESLLPRLVRLNEKQNVYRRGLPLLVVAADWEHLRGNRGRDLADWDRLWGQKDTGSVEGAVRFQGGDLITRARSAPEGLTAQDFRLRPDSAGYRAGKDGKDLGADVDLVGPGPAYERWKQTPEYQQWLKETNQSLVSSP